MSYRFEVSVLSLRPRRCELRATGVLDLDAADLLGAVLGQQVDSGHCFARLDLSAVTATDESSLGTLLNAHDRFLAAHGTLLLTGVRSRIARLIALTGLDEVLFTAAGSAGDLQSGELASDELVRLADRAVIDHALGIISSRSNCTLGEAGDRLQMLSERTDRNLREVAQSILGNATYQARTAVTDHAVA